MDQIKPSMEAELRALANSTQAKHLALISSGILALLFIFYARNIVRFGLEMPIWSYPVGAILVFANLSVLALASLNRISDQYAQATGAFVLLLHGIATYTNLAAGIVTGIYGSALTVLALSMCVLSRAYFQGALILFIVGWLVSVSISPQEVGQWFPTFLLLLITASISFLIFRARIRALKTFLILESRVLELESYLPMCANCSSVRDKAGEWQPLAEYIESSGGQKVSHGVCPSCKDELYGDYLAKRKKKDKAVDIG